jgi:hypothetical protein
MCLIQIIGFCIGLCIPSYISKLKQKAEDDIKFEQRKRLCEMEHRNKQMYEAKKYLVNLKNTHGLFCRTNDFECDELLKKFYRGSISLSLDECYDIYVPLKDKVKKFNYKILSNSSGLFII